jgi:hypothetical protein
MSKYITTEIQGAWVISYRGTWVPGVYDSSLTAETVAENFSDEAIEELFGPIYTVTGEDRAVTMEDYERISDEYSADDINRT